MVYLDYIAGISKLTQGPKVHRAMPVTTRSFVHRTSHNGQLRQALLDAM